MSIASLPSTKALHHCLVCKEPTTNQCVKCQKVFYCSLECQTRDWKTRHKAICGKKKTYISVQEAIACALMHLQMKGTFLKYQIAKLTFATMQEGNCFKLLPESEKRKLMMMILFAYPDEEQKPFDEFERIPGIKIIKRDPHCDISHPNDGAEFVFRDQPWYSSSLTNSLFNFTQETLSLLHTKGYVVTTSPEIGDIVAYSTTIYGFSSSKSPAKISHYGKITQISEDGTVIVESKFGHFHTYEHELGLIPYYFGSLYTFLKRNSQG